jgi:hypothetical protein
LHERLPLQPGISRLLLLRRRRCCFFAPQDLCIRAVSSNFEHSPTFGKLPDASCKRVVDGLALDLPLELVGTVRTDGIADGSAQGRWLPTGPPLICPAAVRLLVPVRQCGMCFQLKN